MTRVLARTLTRCLLASPLALVVAFTACSAAQSTGSGSGSGAASSASAASGASNGGSGGTGGISGTSSSGISLTTGSTGTGPVKDGGCGMTVVSECQKDADCDDGDPSTIDTCIISDPSSEVPTGTCAHVACDGGPSCSMQAVDPTCSLADASVEYPPFVALYPPDVPSTCANGFEVCDAEGAPPYVIHSVSSMGSQGLTLDLDFATYTAPDGILITGIDGNCKQYVLFDTCRISTAENSETSYTNGMARPTDIAIRQFHLTLKPGTTQLTFDFSRVVSPMYFQVLGLCDFTIPPTPGVGWFSLVP
jgi:hypothetical protein